MRPFFLLPILLSTSLLAACAQQPAVDRHAVLRDVLESYRNNIAGMQPTSTPVLPQLDGTPASATQLLGQSPDAVRRWLGEPRLRRNEGNAQVWLYQGQHCNLDVVMDRDDTPSSPLRVSYAAARASGTERRTEAACMSELLRRG
ncbi:hypothetical protein BKE38_20070 [Pseudoroseomonas deserti]|uniref:Lipoprotein SmpA/OmlA domain-containing protein n=1 Tax=Teichococcus deserti TaxID=1817963 RepID=A0A1V2GY01_9PROT|nr:hypothetical protein [Pseudoroseomonas deserti]ONG49980.1 hypothetical protein BKE38_20070 [Pseudoroseomonas deserti]